MFLTVTDTFLWFICNIPIFKTISCFFTHPTLLMVALVLFFIIFLYLKVQASETMCSVGGRWNRVRILDHHFWMLHIKSNYLFLYSKTILYSEGWYLGLYCMFEMYLLCYALGIYNCLFELNKRINWCGYLWLYNDGCVMCCSVYQMCGLKSCVLLQQHFCCNGLSPSLLPGSVCNNKHCIQKGPTWNVHVDKFEKVYSRLQFTAVTLDSNGDRGSHKRNVKKTFLNHSWSITQCSESPNRVGGDATWQEVYLAMLRKN